MVIKTCSKCGFEGEENAFVKTETQCKACRNKYLKEYRKTHIDPSKKEVDENEIKTCSKCGFTGKASEFRKGRNVCKQCTKKKNMTTGNVIKKNYKKDNKNTTMRIKRTLLNAIVNMIRKMQKNLNQEKEPTMQNTISKTKSI
jgi:hypothetical protein